MKPYGIFKVGMHKGKYACDVSEGYLVWYYENVSKDICAEDYYKKAKDALFHTELEHESFIDSIL